MNRTTILDNYGNLLSTGELAEIFETTKGTIYKEIQRGRFGEPIKMGRKYIIPKSIIKENFFKIHDF